MFNKLPDEIYPILQSYLLHDDYLCFVNSSKSDFYEIKRKTIYLKLSSKYSMMFLTNKKNFQQQINGLVADPTKQICIHLSNSHPLTVLEELKVHRVICKIGKQYETLTSFPFLPFVKEFDSAGCKLTKIKDITFLSHLQSVTLAGCHSLMDVSPLRDVPEVSLSDGLNITDFTVLGRQRKLTISNCQNLIDVSSFSNVRELSINYCPLLADISPLKNIPILSLSDCELIRDLTPLLGNHKRLTIDNCNYQLEGYEILQNIPIVCLESCNISDVGVLRKAKSVTLHRCHELVDVSLLAQVKCVDLNACGKIVDVSALAHVPELFIGDLPQVTNAHLLKNQELSLFTYKLHSANLFAALYTRHFQVYNYDDSGILLIIARFNNLQSLSITRARIDFSTEGLGDIPKIIIRECDKLTDISGLGRNREVRLYDCSRIRDVSSLMHVVQVYIYHCPGIIDYSCLSQVPRLNIIINDESH